MLETAIASALLEYAVGIILLYFYAKNKAKTALFFGISILLYAIAHTIGGVVLPAIKLQYHYAVAKFEKNVNYDVFESLRNVLVGGFMALALFGVSEIISLTGDERKAKLVRAYAVIGFVLFLALRLYCVWIAKDVRHPFFALAQWVFLIPGSLVIAIGGIQTYRMGGSLGNLLIALSFLIYAVILPLYALWKGTTLLHVWYGLRIISDVLLLAGVLKL